MKYNLLIEELYRRRNRGIKLGLDRVLNVLEKLDNPQNFYKSIHVAGTNGKGSVSKIIYCLFKAHGFSVGLFTSPHLTRFTERIIVDDQEVSETEIVNLIERVKPFAKNLTFFEYVTVIALLYFKERAVDYAIIETGLGGRLDATNVVLPEVSVLTSIGIDHTDFLGSNIISIAAEKSGIIKRKVPVISAAQESDVERVIMEKAKEMNSEVRFFGRDFHGRLKSISVEGIVFDFHSSNFTELPHSLYNLYLPLIGVHQFENASVAIEAFISSYNEWNEEKIRAGLKRVKMPGRFEIISRKPLVVFDIAHNPQALISVIRSLKIITNKKPVVVFGIMRDKDYRTILQILRSYSEKIIFTSPRYERALRYEELLRELSGDSNYIQSIPDSFEAFMEGVSICKKDDEKFLLCTGSAYLIGELKEALGEKSSLRGLGELL